MAQVNITLSHEEVLQVLSGDRDDAFKMLVERILNAVMLANPIMIVIPCHRVIGSNGQLVGYAGGLDVKKKLLDLEMKYAG